MSDSPKCSTARIRADRQREIEAARRRQAELERARRAEEAARQQRERFYRVQESLRMQVAHSLNEIIETSNSRFADARSVQQLSQEVRQIEQQLNSVADERSVTRLQKQLDKVQGRLKKAVSASRSAAKRQQALRKEVASYNNGPEARRGHRHAPFADQLRGMLTRLDRATSQNDLSSIEAEWSTLRTEMNRFIAECEALDRSIGRVSTKLNELRTTWSRFCGSQAASFLSQDASSSIDVQIREFAEAVTSVSRGADVPTLERNLASLASDANGAISAAEAIYGKVERVRKTLSSLESRANALSGNVVRRFVREDALNKACSQLSGMSAAMNNSNVGSRLDSIANSLVEVERALSSLEEESKEARSYAAQVEKQLARLSRERQRFSRSAAAQFAGSEVVKLDDEIRSVEVGFETVKTVDSLRSTLDRLQLLDARLSEVVCNAEAAQLEHDLQNQQSVLAGLRETMSGVDVASADKFDREGRQRATASLERAESLLDSRQLQKAVKEIVAASRLVNQHVHTVADKRVAYETSRTSAQQAIAAGKQRASELSADSLLEQRLATQVRTIEGHLRQATSLFDREEFAGAEQSAAMAADEVDLVNDLLRAWRRHDEVEADLASLDRSLCVQHDSNGYQSTRQHLAAAANLIRQHNVTQADVELNDARQSFADHRRRLETHLAKWREDRQTAATSLESVRRCLESLSGDAHLLIHVQDSIQAIQSKVARLQERFEQHHFEAVERESAQLVAEVAKATATAQMLAQVVTEQERLAQQLGETASQKFDPHGHQEISRLVSGLREGVRRKQPADLDKELDRLRMRIDQHIILVSEKTAEWNERRAEVGTLIGAAEDQVIAMAADETIMRWAKPDIETVRARLGEVSRMADDGDFDRVKDELVNCSTMSSNIMAAVEAVQMKEEHRNYIVQGIQGVLRDMGFDVDDGYPSPEDCDNPFSATVLRARQGNGRLISVSVPQDREEEVWYEVEGFEMNVDSHEGQLIRTCDGAETQLTQLHEQLRDLGIEMSELWWDGKPEGAWKTADTLPRTEGQPRSQSKSE